MVARKFSVRHNGVDFDVDYDTDDGLEVFRIQLFSLTSVPPDEQKILAVDNDRLVSDESDLAAISDRLQLVSIDEEEKVEKLVEEKSMEEASSSDAELLSDEELARKLQAEEEALMMQQYVVGQNKEEASSSDAELLSDEELARMLQAEEEALMMQQYVVGQNKEEASSSVAELLSDEELARMLQYPVRPDAKQKMKETEESKEKLGQTKFKVKNEAAPEENSGQTKFKVKNEAAPEENSEQTESKRKEIKREKKKAPSGLDEHIKYPVRLDAEDCANYMRTWICKFGSNCKFNHPVQKKVKAAKQKKETEESKEKLGQTKSKVKNEAAAGENSGQTKSKATKEKVKEKIDSPWNTRQVKCKFYSSPEGCKFGKGCKFSHMKTNSAPPPVELNFMGLPMRSGVKDCPYLMRNGTCMSDVNCKFNHPDPTPVIDDEPFLQDIHGEIESTSSQSTQPFPSPK